MKKLIPIFIFLILISSTSAYAAGDEVFVEGFYISSVNGDLYVFEFIGTRLDYGQVSINILDFDIYAGYSTSFYVPDGHFSITDSVITIRENINSNTVFAQGAVGYDYIDLTFDGDNYYHFVHFPFTSASSSFADPFASARPLFDEGFTVPAGLYIVGDDLPSGAYTFSSETGCKIDIQLNNFNHFTISLGPGESFKKYVLKDHEYIYVSGGSVILKTYTGLFD